MAKEYTTQCFEYKEIKTPFGNPITEEDLNELGKEGWELIIVEHGTFIFKRMFVEVKQKKK